MNRLILIGNGFDLAHGRKTCYRDFILWYVKGCFETARQNRQYQDPLITITRQNDTYSYNEAQILSQWVDNYISKVEHPKRRSIALWSSLGDDDRRRDLSPFNVVFNSNLLQLLLSCCNVSNWVDIEGEYYESLKDILELKNEEPRQCSFPLI